ncbi:MULTISPECIES: winged helix-turn-helix transcriptional regulator [unclassified Nocardioides]|uniref:winged helix-turn-helix transcriptional regulator n=1 Tax=unclassified Nocardioides TaxID=2615069 RepID=UPI000703BF74|nr:MULTISPECIES: helix-turn-helix domain-containing protein [unclassified Nocardioides]KRC46598.1 HxlR family transcriptional regulator [Nocardioides sp. Root79]KRC69943.1 HxlR family transcriptional regulator [Nocardioides sp. Root240]
MRLHAPLDDRTAWSPVGHCPIEKAIAVVGSRPAMLIMREAHYGTRRFDDFVTRVGVAPATASTHLRALTDAGLLERQPYQDEGARTRDEYALSPAGADLMPVVIGLFSWGMKHTDGVDDLEFAHVGCAEPVDLRVACAAGHEVGEQDVEVRLRRGRPRRRVRA